MLKINEVDLTPLKQNVPPGSNPLIECLKQMKTIQVLIFDIHLRPLITQSVKSATPVFE